MMTVSFYSLPSDSIRILMPYKTPKSILYEKYWFWIRLTGFLRIGDYCRTTPPQIKKNKQNTVHPNGSHTVQNTHAGNSSVDLGGILAFRIGVLGGGHLQHAHPESVDVDRFIVLLLVHLRRHKLWSTWPHQTGIFLIWSVSANISTW